MKYLLLKIGCFVGDDLLWWRPDGKGYTVDVDQAGRYDEEFAAGYVDSEHSIAIPEAEALRRTRRVVVADELPRLRACRFLGLATTTGPGPRGAS